MESESEHMIVFAHAELGILIWIEEIFVWMGGKCCVFVKTDRQIRPKQRRSGNRKTEETEQTPQTEETEQTEKTEKKNRPNRKVQYSKLVQWLLKAL